jgi:hypothetical protein
VPEEAEPGFQKWQFPRVLELAGGDIIYIFVETKELID